MLKASVILNTISQSSNSQSYVITHQSFYNHVLIFFSRQLVLSRRTICTVSVQRFGNSNSSMAILFSRFLSLTSYSFPKSLKQSKRNHFTVDEEGILAYNRWLSSESRVFYFQGKSRSNLDGGSVSVRVKDNSKWNIVSVQVMYYSKWNKHYSKFQISAAYFSWIW